MVGTQGEPSAAGAPGIFTAPQLMPGSYPSADPRSGRANHSCITAGHDQLNPGKIQPGLNPAGQEPALDRLARRGCPGRRLRSLLSPAVSHLQINVLTLGGTDSLQGAESQLAAWAGRTVRLHVAIQWVQAPEPGENHFFPICGAQNPNTADFSVTRPWGFQGEGNSETEDFP